MSRNFCLKCTRHRFISVLLNILNSQRHFPSVDINLIICQKLPIRKHFQFFNCLELLCGKFFAFELTGATKVTERKNKVNSRMVFHTHTFQRNLVDFSLAYYLLRVRKNLV